jgi:hypothetical protein
LLPKFQLIERIIEEETRLKMVANTPPAVDIMAVFAPGDLSMLLRNLASPTTLTGWWQLGSAPT